MHVLQGDAAEGEAAGHGQGRVEAEFPEGVGRQAELEARFRRRRSDPSLSAAAGRAEDARPAATASEPPRNPRRVVLLMPAYYSGFFGRRSIALSLTSTSGLH